MWKCLWLSVFKKNERQKQMKKYKNPRKNTNIHR